MKKIVIISIVLALVIAGAIFATNIDQAQPEAGLMEKPDVAEDKKLPGDSMTERAIQNAESGKPQMDSESLPDNNKPKANEIQGGVILEGSANDELKVK